MCQQDEMVEFAVISSGYFIVRKRWVWNDSDLSCKAGHLSCTTGKSFAGQDIKLKVERSSNRRWKGLKVKKLKGLQKIRAVI